MAWFKKLTFDHYLALGVALLLMVFYALFQKEPLLVDEPLYYNYILSVKAGIIEKPLFTTLPGYAFFVAGISWLIHASTIAHIRTIAFILNIGAICAVTLLAHKLNPKTYMRSSLLWVFVPIIFPFLFLIYTDVFSVLMIVTAFYLHLRKDYRLSGLVGFLSWFVRQNNVIWLLLLAVFAWIESPTKERLKNVWVHVLGLGAFAAFIYINKGIAVGDASAHPSKIMSSGNVFFFLFVFFILFLPYNIAQFPKIIRLFKKLPALALFVISIFIVYMLNFDVTHQYNLHRGYYIHNDIALFMVKSTLFKVLSFLPIAYAAFSLLSTEWHNRKYVWILPMIVLYLLPSWLIEQRYYLIPITLFILLKKPSSPEVEYTGIAWGAFLTGMITVGILSGFIFL
jgi:alpha-1,2-glucosyltransferase